MKPWRVEVIWRDSQGDMIDRLAALIAANDPTGRRDEVANFDSLLAARLAAQGVTVGIDPERLVRDMRTIAAMATDPSHDKVALIVTLGRIHDIARAYEERNP